MTLIRRLKSWVQRDAASQGEAARADVLRVLMVCTGNIRFTY